jgi:hypothetical protein
MRVLVGCATVSNRQTPTEWRRLLATVTGYYHRYLALLNDLEDLSSLYLKQNE